MGLLLPVMVPQGYAIEVLPDTFAVCRLDPGAEVPPWASQGSIVSVSRTDAELSIVCAASVVPPGVAAERHFRALRVRGPLPFDAVGVLASLVGPLAGAGISIFSISTYDTDYLLMHSDHLEPAIRVLKDAGHVVEQD